MPELPEVECLTRAVRKITKNSVITQSEFYRTDLREPIPVKAFAKQLHGQKISQVKRRSKYLLMFTDKSVAIFHLGMSGQVLSFDTPTPKLKHTHAVLYFESPDQGKVYLHYVDPRRFGFINVCLKENLKTHRYFSHLGPEPLEHRSLGDYLYRRSRNSHTCIKSFIMNAKNLVGVGNIYASESLFKAAVHPLTPANEVSHESYLNLGRAIQDTLKLAIKAGGTTFRDFRNPDGNPGYFSIQLGVYGRTGLPCPECKAPIQHAKVLNRSTFYCPNCQI